MSSGGKAPSEKENQDAEEKGITVGRKCRELSPGGLGRERWGGDAASTEAGGRACGSDAECVRWEDEVVV